MKTFRRKGTSRYQIIYNQAAQLPLNYLRCRAMGHLWSDPIRKVLNVNTERLTSDCTSCDAARHTDWTLRGSIEDSGITYPPGYVMHETGLLETADRNILRQIYLARLREEAA